MALQRDETNRLAEERVQIAAMVKKVKQQIWTEMGGTSRGRGITPSNPKCDHPDPNTDPIPMTIDVATNNPNPAPKSRR